MEAIFKSAGEKIYDLTHPDKKRIYLFSEGSIYEKSLLGNKGANLCEMYRLKLPVPPGFVITTESCIDFIKDPDMDLSSHLVDQYTRAVHHLEKETGKIFGLVTAEKGKTQIPLLLSVRSGAAVSMPGMMDTVLNLGINQQRVELMARISKNPRWAYDTYRRFLQMFGSVVLGLDKEPYEDILKRAREKAGVTHDSMLDAAQLQMVVREFLAFAPVPDDPWVQLRMSVEAVFKSWSTPRAIKYRDIHSIPSNLGTAVTIQTMVYGNLNARSGSGVAFSRNPSTGANDTFYGEYLINAEGEDVVSGVRTPMTLEDLRAELPEVHNKLLTISSQLERHYKDMQDMEFTVENGVLFILQTRTGKRTARAAVAIAVKMVEERLITEREAVCRIHPSQMDFFLHPMIDPDFFKSKAAVECLVGKGLAASAGAAIGKLAFDCKKAEAMAKKGERSILCRHDTSADDISGMFCSEGAITIHGGLTSHAAVVMRGMGKPAVTGARNMQVNYQKKQLIGEDIKGSLFVLKEGDTVTVDGSTGCVYSGSMPTVFSGEDADFQTVLRWADQYRRMGVMVNADTIEDAERGYKLGAEGIGLIRTEHMFFKKDRIDLFRKMILSLSLEERKPYLRKILPMQQADFLDLFRLSHKKQMTVRLLDPPLHEFLPSPEYTTELAELCMEMGLELDQGMLRIKSLKESNPMLGFRGCRTAILHPEIMAMQVNAIIGAAVQAVEEGLEVHPQIMVPLVCSDHEIDALMPIIKSTYEGVISQWGARDKFATEKLHKAIPLSVGCMLETPRACLRADRIAQVKGLDFVSIGSNDLTQLIFAFSRDDTQRFIPAYLDYHLLANNPFATLDIPGVGAMVELAVNKCHNANRHVKIGICGEHGGDPASIRFFDKLAYVDYVSCSPSRLPCAKLAAAQAHIEEMQRHEQLALDLAFAFSPIPL